MCVITPTIAAWAVGGAIAGKTATDIYASKKIGNFNERSLTQQAQSNAEERAQEERLAAAKIADEQRRQAELLDAQAAEAEKTRAATERTRQENLAFDRERWQRGSEIDAQRWQDYIASRQPFVQASASAYGNLLGLMQSGGRPATGTVPMPTVGIAPSFAGRGQAGEMPSARGGVPSIGKSTASRFLPIPVGGREIYDPNGNLVPMPRPTQGALSLADLFQLATMRRTALPTKTLPMGLPSAPSWGYGVNG